MLVQEGLLPNSKSHVLLESAQEIIGDIESQPDIDITNLSTSDLGIYANPRENLKLLTMHRAKGREFEAVALISLHDGQIPFHNRHSPLTPVGLAEAKRLLYVAGTRAERLLYLFSNQDYYRPPTRFLNDVEEVIQKI